MGMKHCRCEKRGGHIATITSKTEWHAINRVHLGKFPTVITLVVQMKKLKAFGNGSQNEAWNFTKWAKGEPNNLFRKQYGDEDHLQTWTATVMEIAYGMIFTTRRTHGRTVTS